MARHFFQEIVFFLTLRKKLHWNLHSFAKLLAAANFERGRFHHVPESRELGKQVYHCIIAFQPMAIINFTLSNADFTCQQ